MSFTLDEVPEDIRESIAVIYEKMGDAGSGYPVLAYEELDCTLPDLIYAVWQNLEVPEPELTGEMMLVAGTEYKFEGQPRMMVSVGGVEMRYLVVESGYVSQMALTPRGLDSSINHGHITDVKIPGDDHVYLATEGERA